MAGPYGDVTVGRITLGEDGFELSHGPDGVLEVAARLFPDDGDNDVVERRVSDLVALDGQLVPVRFTHRPQLDGFYRAAAAAVTHGAYPRYFAGAGPLVVVAAVKVTLRRVGYGNTVEVESRLSGARTRSTDLPVVGEVWHAPPPGHAGYRGRPVARTARVTADGTLVVYRGIAAGSAPRWTATLDGFGAGRCRFVDDLGLERSGTGFPLPLTDVTGGLFPAAGLFPAVGLAPDAGTATVPGWEVSNGLLRVRPASVGGLFTVAVFGDGGWSTAKSWDVRVGGGPVGPVSSAQVVENTFDTVTVRMVCALQPGQVIVDATVRRGARVVELHIESTRRGRLALLRGTPDAGTAGVGWVAAAAVDGGWRYLVGSARTHLPDLTGGGIVYTPGLVMDGFVGAVADGAGDGDTADDLLAQYLGSPAETVGGVRR